MGDGAGAIFLDLCRAAAEDHLGRVLSERTGSREVQAHAALGGFFGDHALAEQVEAGTAVLGGRLGTPQPELARLAAQARFVIRQQAHRVVRHAVFGGLDLALHEAPHRPGQQAVFVGQGPGAGGV